MTHIVTLTLNPALDMGCSAPSVQPTHKVRTTDEHLDPGGGGINVARVIHALGGDVLALIMTGGVTGRQIESWLTEAGIRWRAVPIQGLTRISLNVRDRTTGLEYRFVPEGPKVRPAEWQGMLELLLDVPAEWVVASGSLPQGVPTDFYARAAAIAKQRGQKFALDTSGAALWSGTGGGVELLKLSLGEFESLAGQALSDAAAQDRAAAALVGSGMARAVAVSLGKDGALLADSDGVLRLPALEVEAHSAVGAGDSFLAGLVLGLAKGLPKRTALAWGIAAGAAAVFSSGTARVERAMVEALMARSAAG